MIKLLVYTPHEMQKLHIVKGKESGNLFARKATANKNGCMLEILSTPTSSTDSKFVRTAFSPCGERFVAADQLGQLIVFDLHKNRYNILLKGQRYCTALDFPSLHLIVAAFADESVKVIELASQSVIGDLSHPNVTVKSMSHHEAGRYLVTCSTQHAAMWDLETLSKKRTLAGSDGVGIKDVLFVPGSNTLVSCHRNDAILGWDCETLERLFTLATQQDEQPAFSSYCTTANGEYFVAGGRYLHVWKMSTQKLHHIVELPDKVKSVKQLLPLPQVLDHNNTVFGVLSQDGIVRFISLHTYKIVFTIGDTVSLSVAHVSVSPTGKHLAIVLSNGNLQLINIKSVTKQLNAPPVSMVKAVRVPPSEVELKHVENEKTKRRCFNENPPNVAQITAVDVKKLKKILKGFGEYPEKYRHFIWRLLLKLPENNESYGVLLDKGIHPVFANLHKTCPIKSPKLQRCLQRYLLIEGDRN